MRHLKPLSLALALAATAATPAAALADSGLTTDAAMRKGIRDVARLEGHGAKVSAVRVHCGARGAIGHTAHCSGSFRLTLDGRSATYNLTAKASVFNNTPGSLEYHVFSRAEHKVKGLPGSTGLAGFLQ